MYLYNAKLIATLTLTLSLTVATFRNDRPFEWRLDTIQAYSEGRQ